MNLHVSNLSPSTTSEDLRKAFAAHGALGIVSVPADGMKDGLGIGTGRGYGFVQMKNAAEARAALAALDRKDFQGRPMSVRVARPSRDAALGR